MSKVKHIFDTLKIGAGIIGAKEGIEYVNGGGGFDTMFENIYMSVVDGGEILYGFSNSSIDYLSTISNNELMMGFGIGVISNIAAGFIKSEYGSITNLIKRKRLKEEPIYSRFR
ncbi:MAG: hypothetical protein K0B07_05090 [DPANN group archaeon]|nr:hypothetical protein [DPANN group archaeon]